MTLSHDTLSFLLTYLLHSSFLLGAVWLLLRTRLVRAPSLEDALWKVGLLGGLVTASAQVGLGVEPLGGQLELSPPAATERRAPADLSLVQRALSRPADAAVLPQLTWLANAPAMLQREASHDRVPRISRELSSSTPSQADRNATRFADRAVLSVPVVPPQRAHFFPAKVVDDSGSSEQPVASGQPAVSHTAGVALSWIDAVVALWLVVASLGLLRFGLARQRLKAALSSRQPVRDPHLLVTLDRLQNAGDMRRVVRLSVSPLLAGPVAMGREIVLPRRVLSQLGARQQEAVLAHELGHIARRDPLWLQICAVLQAVFFFQPLNPLGRRRMQETSEFLCDDWAVSRTGQRLVLAQCLAQVAGWVTDKRPPALVAGMVRKDSSFLRRVERLAGADVVRRSLRPAHTALLSLAVVSLVSCSVPSFSWGDDDEPSLLTRFVSALENALNANDDALEPQSQGDAGNVHTPVDAEGTHAPQDAPGAHAPHGAPGAHAPHDAPGSFAPQNADVIVKWGKPSASLADVHVRSHAHVSQGVDLSVETHTDVIASTPEVKPWAGASKRAGGGPAISRAGNGPAIVRAGGAPAIVHRRAPAARTRSTHSSVTRVTSEEGLVLRLENGQLVDATHGDREIAALGDDGSVTLSTAGNVHLDDDVLTVTDEDGHTLLTLQLGDENDVHFEVREEPVHGDFELEHELEHEHALERSLQAMEREYELAERELERSLQVLERDFERELEGVEREYERALTRFERAHELEYVELEHDHEAELSALEVELAEFLERASDDQLDDSGDEWLENWEQSFEELNAAFEESVELLDETFVRECEELEESFEDDFEIYDAEFEEAFETAQADLEALELEYELALEAMFDRDCDHDCETRCDGGCTHPEPEFDGDYEPEVSSEGEVECETECEVEPEPEPQALEAPSDLVVIATR
ncbi:MAG: hypothetical protein DHS20C15_31050 [Planctomycetota bacterium]|nr:MAG: hypothetical protein DHS20C15_31050 [Planctomycetota bacterium]